MLGSCDTNQGMGTLALVDTNQGMGNKICECI